MGAEAASPLMMEPTTNMSAYTYTVIKTAHPIAAAVRQIAATGIEHLALVAITLCFDQEDRARRADRSAAYVLDNLRPLVRKTDVVFLLGHTLYFVLIGANQQGASIVQSRLWDASLWCIHNIAERDIQRPYALHTGHSTYPAPYADIDEFIKAAPEARLTIDWQSEKSSRKPASEPPVRQNLPEEELPTLARKMGIPYLSFLPRHLPEEVQHIVNPKLAQELHCYPLGRERNTLTVAMSDPRDHSALDRLREETGLRIFPVLTHPQELQTALEQLI